MVTTCCISAVSVVESPALMICLLAAGVTVAAAAAADTVDGEALSRIVTWGVTASPPFSMIA